MTMPSFDDVKSKATGLLARTRSHQPASQSPSRQARHPDSFCVPKQHPRGPRPLPTKPSSSELSRTATATADADADTDKSPRQDECSEEPPSSAIARSQSKPSRIDTTGLQAARLPQSPARTGRTGTNADTNSDANAGAEIASAGSGSSPTMSSPASMASPKSTSLVPAALKPRPQPPQPLLQRPPSPPSPSTTGAVATKARGALRSPLALCRDPQSVTFADIHAAAATAEDFRQSHGEQMVSSASRAHHVEQRYGHGITERLERLTIRNGHVRGDGQSQDSPSQDSRSQDSRSRAGQPSPVLPSDVASMLARKKAPPPRPRRKPVPPTPPSNHDTADNKTEDEHPEPWDFNKHAFL